MIGATFMIPLLLTRVPYTGETVFLERLTKQEEVDKLINTSDTALIIFGDYKYVLDFMDFGMHRTREKINYAAAPSALGQQYGCKRMPCFVPFHDKKMVDIKFPTLISGDVASYLDKIQNPRNYRFTSIEQLRYIFQHPEPSVLCVDSANVPSDIPDEIPIYHCTSKLLDQYGLKDVEKGTYIFTHTDHTLRKMTRPYAEMNKTSFVEAKPHKMTKTDKKYWVCYFGGDSSENWKIGTEAQELMDELYSKFNDTFAFSLITGQDVTEFRQPARLAAAREPFIAVFNATNISSPRWVFQDHDYANVSAWEDKLAKIKEGSLPVKLISAPIPEQNDTELFREVVADSFTSEVMGDGYDSLFVLTAPWCGHCARFKPFLNETAHLINTPQIKFFWIDGTANEFDPVVPSWKGFPTLFLFPDGNKTNPVTFDGNRNAIEVLKFINDYAAHKVNTSEIDLTRLRPFEE